jgi:hypothetical protein
MANTVRQTTVTFKPRAFRFLDSFVDLGFQGLATICGVVFLLEGLGWVALSAPVKVLILGIWCPFLWGRYWAAKQDERRWAWYIFSCAILFTATTVLAAVVVLIKLAG